MVTLEEFMAIISEVDPKQLALIVAVTALLLILLIVWAIVKGKRDSEEAKRTPETKGTSAAQSQASSVSPAAEPKTQQPVAAPADAGDLVAARVEVSSTVQSASVQQNKKDEAPEDSVQHRHYLANEAAKETALHEPYPTDSVLRRHYDTAHKISVPTGSGSVAPARSQPVAARQQVGEIPQDSVLHRHYLANEEAKATALHEPYPTDSVLRRHYDAAHKIVVESSPANKVVAEPSQVTEDLPKAGVIEQVAVSSALPEEPRVLARVAIPQDSVLMRHFISQLQAEIEADLSPRPTDSVLRRHYDSLVRSELEKRLAR